MSHPLGPLSHNLTALTIYSTAQAEMRHAYHLVDRGDFLAAAAELEQAAQVAEVLVRATSALDEVRTQHWRRVVVARRRFAARAREAGGRQSLAIA